MVLHRVILKMNLTINLIDNGTHYSCEMKKILSHCTQEVRNNYS